MRILVLTEEASLAIALSQMPFGHDVVAIDAIEQLEGHDLSFQVALVDLGTTRRGLVGASDVVRAGVSAPCLIVGDESPIELAVELAPDASVIARPFALEDLDARLEELAALAWNMRQEDLETEMAAEGTPAEQQGGDELALPVTPFERSTAGTSIDAPPTVDFHVRGSQSHDRAHQTRIEHTESLLGEGLEVELFLDHLPEVVDPRAVAEGLLGAIEDDLRPLVSVLWVPVEGGGYEALAARHLESEEGVPFDQSLFLSFETNLDAVLVVQVDPLQHPIAGIPGIRGDTLIAAALRTGDALQGVAMAAGDGYTEVERDRLQRLAVESAPALSVAQAFERLRSRKLDSALPPPNRHLGN